MTGSSNRFLMSLPADLLKYIDETVEVINLTKTKWSPRVNRQALIRAVIRYCKEKNPQFSSGYSKWVSINDEEKSK